MKNDNYKIKGIILLVAIFLYTDNIFCQDMRVIENNTFQIGERLSYRVYYDNFLPGNVTVGDATFEVRESNVEIAGRPTMHVVGKGKTRRFFNMFYRVDNYYETYIDKETIAPWYFRRNIYEGGYERDESFTFDQFRNIAYTDDDKKVSTTNYVQDIISLLYYARTLDVSDVKVGDEFDISFFFSDSVYVTKIIFDGYEKIKTRMGEINTLRFKPKVLTGSVFKQPYPMTLWISDDENKIPVLLESEIIIGSVKFELSGYKGLRNEFRAKLE